MSKSKYGLSWSVLLSTTSTRHSSSIPKHIFHIVARVLKAPRPNDVAEVRSFHRHVTDKFSKDLSTRVIYKINCKDCDKVYISQTSRALRSRTREHKRAICTKDRNSLLTQHCIKSIIILTLTMSRSLTTVPNGQKDYF